MSSTTSPSAVASSSSSSQPTNAQTSDASFADELQAHRTTMLALLAVLVPLLIIVLFIAIWKLRRQANKAAQQATEEWNLERMTTGPVAAQAQTEEYVAQRRQNRVWLASVREGVTDQADRQRDIEAGVEDAAPAYKEEAADREVVLAVQRQAPPVYADSGPHAKSVPSAPAQTDS